MIRQLRIQTCLLETLAPKLLDVQDESHRHNVPKGAESHFKLTVVSEKFLGQTRIQCHRMVNDLLADEFKSGLHALSLHLYTPEKWAAISGQIPKSPPCHNGEK